MAENLEFDHTAYQATTEEQPSGRPITPVSHVFGRILDKVESKLEGTRLGNFLGAASEVPLILGHAALQAFIAPIANQNQYVKRGMDHLMTTDQRVYDPLRMEWVNTDDANEAVRIAKEQSAFFRVFSRVHRNLFPIV